MPLKNVIFHLFCLTDRVSNISNHFTFHAISILDMLESRACVANIPAKRIESILPAKIESKRYKCTKLLKIHAKLYPSEWHIANRREERKKRPWQNYSHTLKHDISYIKVRFVGCFSLIKKNLIEKTIHSPVTTTAKKTGSDGNGILKRRPAKEV